MKVVPIQKIEERIIALSYMLSERKYDNKDKILFKLEIEILNTLLEDLSEEILDIDEPKVSLDIDKPKISILQIMRKANDIHDIDTIIQDAVNDMGEVEIESVILSDEDKEIIAKKYRDNYDWEKSCYHQLCAAINHYLDNSCLDEPKTVDVYFKDEDSPLRNLTQFDNVMYLRELGKLWVEFAKENDIPVTAVTGYEIQD